MKDWKRKLLIVSLSSVLLLPSVVYAKDYLSTSLSGTNAESGFVKLGKGTRYLKGKGTYGNGTIKAKEIVKWLPDNTKATVKVKNKTNFSKSFKSKATASNGANQSYYVHWQGNSARAKVNVKLSDKK